MKKRILFFILAFLTSIGVANTVLAAKLGTPIGQYTTNADNQSFADLKISAPADYTGNIEDLTIHYMEYERFYDGITSMFYYQCKKVSKKGQQEVSEEYALIGGMGPQFFGAYVSAPGYDDSDIVYFSHDNYLYELEKPRVKINGKFTNDGTQYNIASGSKVEIVNPNVYECTNGDAAPFKTCFGKPRIKIGSSVISRYEGLPEGVVPDNDGNVVFTAEKNLTLSLRLYRTWSVFEEYSPYKKVNLTVGGQLPTPVVDWGWTTDGSDKSVRLTISLPDGATLPFGLTTEDIKVQELNYTSGMELNTPVTSLKTLNEFEEGFDWTMNEDPFTVHALYDIRLSADGCEPSEPVLVSFENKKIKLPTPEVWVDGVLVEDDGSSTVTRDVYIGSKVSVRKRDGMLSGYKNDILDFPARQVAYGQVWYRERLWGQDPDNAEINIPQTEEGDLSYFIVDKSLVGKTIYHRHRYDAEEGYTHIFETSERTPFHSMAIKSKGKLNIAGIYSQNKDNEIMWDMAIAALDYSGNADDVTLHYIEYSSGLTLSSYPYLPYYFSRKASAKGIKFTTQYANYGGTKPDFFAAYASAPGYEDSDVFYFKADGEELKTESPRVYVNGNLVAYRNSSVFGIKIPKGAEVRIENPNNYKLTEGEAAPFVTCIGTAFYSGLPDGVTPDESGNVTFTAESDIDLELNLIATNVPNVFDGWNTTICGLVIGGKLDAPECSFKWDEAYADYKVSIYAPKTYGGNLDDLTIHYVEYFGAGVNEEKSSQLRTTVGRHIARFEADAENIPDFYAAYVSAEGFEDSDVVYFTVEHDELNPFKIESPRVYVNGELVAHAELNPGYLTIPLGAEIRIENPNVFTPVTVRTRAAEGEAAPFETRFGTAFYKGLPSGVTPDANGNVTFTANEPGQDIPLELSLFPSGAFDGWHQTICLMTVNTQTGVENIESESNVHEEIYTMDGIRVTGKKLQKGVYIVVRNGKATKKVVNE